MNSSIDELAEKAEMKRLMICLTTLVSRLPCTAPPELRAGEPIDMGSRRELFTDRTLIQRIDGQMQLRLHHPTPREIVMTHDEPWEGNNTTIVPRWRPGKD